MGYRANASGLRSIAIGGGDDSPPNGAGTVASGQYAIAIGAFSSATMTNSVAIGPNAQATRADQFAMGTSTSTYTLPGVTSAASTSAQSGTLSVLTTDASGNLAATTLSGLSACLATGGSTTCGTGSATGTNSNAFGSSTVNGNNSNAFGTGNAVTGDNSGAFGTGQTVRGNGSFAIGDPNTVNGNGTFVIGNNTNINATGGTGTAGWGDNINAFGSNNTIADTASAAGSAVFGNSNTVTSTNAVALGNSITVSGASAIAIGNGATASALNAVALGAGSSATASGSVAIGNASVADVANTVSVGAPGLGRKIVNLASGTVASGSTDAINGGQLFTLQNQINNGSIGLVQQSAAGQPITVGAATDGTVVNFAGTAGNRNLVGINAIGIGTTTPVANLGLQITKGDTPGLRLDQSGGPFTPQTWDIAGNEANFFVRDVTGGSRLPFRIRPGAPTSSIDIRANGDVGFGTDNPVNRIHAAGTDTQNRFATFGPGQSGIGGTGAAGFAGFNVGYAGSTLGSGTGLLNAYSMTGTDGRLVFATDGTTRMTLASTGAIALGTGATGSASGIALGNGAQATFANSVALGAGSIASVANTVSVGASGNERKIVNVAAGTVSSTSTDAVNGSQLAALQSQVGNGSIGLVQQAGAGQPITVGAATDGTVVDFTGTAGARKLTGISAGALTTTSTDAVNGAQLLSANQRVAQAFGTTLDGNGQLNAPSYTIQGTAHNSVGSAFGAVDGEITSLRNGINNGTVGLVQQNASTRVITIGASTDGTVVNVAGTAGNRQVTGVAAGAVSAASTDAVNGGQLFATNQQVASNTAAIGTLTGQVSQNTTDIAAINSNMAGLSQNANYVKVNGSGPTASASGSNAIAIGSNARATQTNTIAMGTNASATGVAAIAIGAGASATGSVAVGAQASAANGGAAFGDGALATGPNAMALGPNASATAANSVAIGSNSVASLSNTVSVGAPGDERRITNVAAGINPTDAVNLGQLQNMASGLQTQITDNDYRARRGIAATAAMTSPSMPSAKGRTSWTMNTAMFSGEVGVGFAMAHRLTTDIPLYLSAGYSNGGGREHVMRAGVGGEF